MLLPKRNLSLLLLLLFSVFSKANKTKITALTLKVVNVHLSKENYLHEYIQEFDCKILWPLSYLVLGFFARHKKKSIGL
jgi:hypothetical protein